VNRFKGRPARGLPGDLPAGEAVLWQGAPNWASLARRAFRVRFVALYFAALLILRVGATLLTGRGAVLAVQSAVSGLVLGGVATGLFCLFAWLMSRSTVYTVTSKRVVITYGMALPKSLNLPFNRIDAANLLLHADGTGDLALRLPAKTRLSYLLLWPHVRSGGQGRSEPVLRCIPQAAEVARTLAAAIGGMPAVFDPTVDATRPVMGPADHDLAGARAA